MDNEQRIEEIIRKLTLKEKIDMLGGQSQSIRGIPGKNIPSFKLTDGPCGVHWWCKASTAYPASIALAAAWDKSLAAEFGKSIGRDCRARGIHYLLGPGVNISRSPLCGRNFEYTGEDPCLASEIVVPLIEGIQSEGVAATVKHFAVNFQEYDRHNISSDTDDRTLNEIYFPAFKAAVEKAKTAAVMTSYNPVNCVQASENKELITDYLRDKWNFQGIVMSDWGATYSGVNCANAGQDLEMPEGNWMNYENLAPAVENGRISEETINDKIRRMLKNALRFGWLDNVQENKAIPHNDPESAETALRIGHEGIVMLKNQDDILPIQEAENLKIAVLGYQAVNVALCGGGSAYATPFYEVSVLEALKKKIPGNSRIEGYVGVNPWDLEKVFTNVNAQNENMNPGYTAEYFDNPDFQGQAVLKKEEETINHNWQDNKIAEEISDDNLGSVRWTGKIKAEDSTDYYFYMNSNDTVYRLYINDELLASTFEDGSFGMKRVLKKLEAEKEYKVVLEMSQCRKGYVMMNFGWDRKEAVHIDYDKALKAASEADIVIFGAGFSMFNEREGMDRAFEMDSEIEDFLLKVADINSNTVVLLNGGSSLAVSRWKDKVKGILHLWYLGQETGNAVSDILLGNISPSGKLPVTYYEKLEDCSSYNCYHDEDNDKRVELSDGIFVGYRHMEKYGKKPLYPFGFGLSYTDFEYEKPKTDKNIFSENESLKIALKIKNTGNFPGREIVQLYVSDCNPSVPRPVKELKDFQSIKLAPQKTGKVEFILNKEAFSFFHPDRKEWTVEAGNFKIHIASSSEDIRHTVDVKITD